MNKVALFFRVLNRKFQRKYDKFIEAEPMVASECVARTVGLLRRDFPIDVQNEIILSVSAKLNELRDKDIIQMELDFEKMKSQTELFKSKVCC